MFKLKTIILILLLVVIAYQIYKLYSYNYSIVNTSQKIVLNAIEENNEEIMNRIQLFEENVDIKITEHYKKINDIYNKTTEINKMNNQTVINQYNQYEDNDLNNNCIYNSDESNPIGAENNKNPFIKPVVIDKELYMSSNSVTTKDDGTSTNKNDDDKKSNDDKESNDDKTSTNVSNKGNNYASKGIFNVMGESDNSVIQIEQNILHHTNDGNGGGSDGEEGGSGSGGDGGSGGDEGGSDGDEGDSDGDEGDKGGSSGDSRSSSVEEERSSGSSEDGSSDEHVYTYNMPEMFRNIYNQKVKVIDITDKITVIPNDAS